MEINEINEKLKGKVISHVEFLSDKEMRELGWYNKPMLIVFTDGSFLIPMRDNEGNDGGCITYQNKDEFTKLYTS